MNKHDISCNIIRMTNAKLKYDTATRSKFNIHFDFKYTYSSVRRELAILYRLIAYFIMTHCA